MSIPEENEGLSADQFASAFAHSLEKHGQLLKLLRETLNKSPAVERRIFCPIRAVLKAENTSSIPTILTLSTVAKSLDIDSCRFNQSFLCILYDMEENSRVERLVEMKRAYAEAVKAIECCLGKIYPQFSEFNCKRFVYAFFPFLFGIYPYTSVRRLSLLYSQFVGALKTRREAAPLTPLRSYPCTLAGKVHPRPGCIFLDGPKTKYRHP